MCKEYLWPIFHYLSLPDNISKKTEQAAWDAYYETNMVYAKRVASVYKPGDLVRFLSLSGSMRTTVDLETDPERRSTSQVWIHDYHLLLVPQMLRELLQDQNPSISLFLHCPFPSSEFFRCLPRREELLDGMLGCNLVCFQTHSYARHFLSSCVRVNGYEARASGVDVKGRIVHLANCPIGIDVDNVEHDRQQPGVLPKVEALRRLYAGKKIIVGRDKLDPTKGVLPKLRAFERFLHDYPEWANKVVLMQVTSPSPGDSPALATKVSELVDQINGTYGSLEFQPVHHYHQTIERDEYFALLSVADLALITSRRDGMNTTSMEYIICQAEAKGPLIVSEFTGVSAVLNKAIKVNPWDLGGVARAIDSCLNMPLDERTVRHGALHRAVTSQTAAVWAHTNILKLLESLQDEQATQNTPELDEEVVAQKYQQSHRRLLMFDYDGTLTPIVKDPSAATPSPVLLSSLEALARDPKNVVYIISGRDGAFLEEHLGHIPNLGMSAEHGCFLRAPGAKEWISLTDDLNMDWKTDVVRIFRCALPPFSSPVPCMPGPDRSHHALLPLRPQTTRHALRAPLSRRRCRASRSTTATPTPSLASSRVRFPVLPSFGSHARTVTHPPRFARPQPRSARPCLRACRRACRSTSSSARRTSRSARHTPTRARSSAASCTSTRTPSSACAPATTRRTRTWCVARAVGALSLTIRD